MSRRIPTSFTKVQTSRALARSLAGSHSCKAENGGVFHIDGHQVTKAVYEAVRDGVPLVAAVDAPFNPALPVEEFTPARIRVGCAEKGCPCFADTASAPYCYPCYCRLMATHEDTLFLKRYALKKRAVRRRSLSEKMGLVTFFSFYFLAGSKLPSVAFLAVAAVIAVLVAAWLWIAAAADENAQAALDAVDVRGVDAHITGGSNG